MTTPDDTITRALSDAEAESLAAAAEAYARGEIKQREVAAGVWQLARGRN